MSETATMAWRDSRQPRRVVVYDLPGDETAFQQFMDKLNVAWDAASLGTLAVALEYYLREQLRGRRLAITPVRDGQGVVFEVRPGAWPIVGWFGDGTKPDVWHLTRLPKETPTETLCGELVGDPQVIIPMHELALDASRCESCIEIADSEEVAPAR